MPLTAPFHVMAKPAGPACQLRCEYCFYLEKKELFPARDSLRMKDETLEAFVREFIQSQDGPEIVFAWQGGEPTLRGLDFYRRVVQLQQQHRGNRTVLNAFQTNGMLIDDDWAAFLAEHRFLVGVSIDGPADLHDAYRVDASGGGTHADVLACIERLQAHGVEFNTLTVVNNRNVRHPLRVYRHLQEIGSTYLQFIPLVERQPRSAGGAGFCGPPGSTQGVPVQMLRASVAPVAYGRFLTTIFEHWVRHDVGRTSVQLFDSTLQLWLGGRHTMCVLSETCGRQLAMEHDGSVYACDHYVYPEYRIGRLGEDTLADMVDSRFQQAFGTAKRDTLPAQCRQCEVLAACWGGCPKHRFLHTADGEPGLNYLCAAYKHFFTTVAPQMTELARRARSGVPLAGEAPAQAAGSV